MNAYQRLIETAHAHNLKVRQTRPGHAAVSCPGPLHHRGDRRPSLSLDRADDRVLVHCHAGCDLDNVLAAIGLTLADLYDDAHTTGYSGRKTGRKAEQDDAMRRWLSHVGDRAVQQGDLEERASYWQRRAAEFEAVGTPECDAISLACNEKAGLAPVQDVAS